MQTMQDTSERKKQAGLGVAAAVVALVLVGALVWWQRETVAEWLGIADDAQSSGPEVGVNLSEVSDHPQALYGRQVVVSADVEEVTGANAMIVGSGEVVVGDQVLVVSNSPLGNPSGAVQIRGEVRRFERNTVIEEFGVEAGDLDYDGSSMIVASQVTAAPPPTVPGDTEDAGPSAGRDEAVSINDIVNGVDDLAGREVTVSGEIERILSPQAIRFGDAMLLAVGPMDEEPFIEAMAEITGVVETFDLEQAEETLGIDLDDSLRDFEGEPVVLVHDLNVVR